MTMFWLKYISCKRTLRFGSPMGDKESSSGNWILYRHFSDGSSIALLSIWRFESECPLLKVVPLESFGIHLFSERGQGSSTLGVCVCCCGLCVSSFFGALCLDHRLGLVIPT